MGRLKDGSGAGGGPSSVEDEGGGGGFGIVDVEVVVCVVSVCGVAGVLTVDHWVASSQGLDWDSSREKVKVKELVVFGVESGGESGHSVSGLSTTSVPRDGEFWKKIAMFSRVCGRWRSFHSRLGSSMDLSY